MRSYSKTGLMELSRKYRSILKKCAILNVAVLMATSMPAQAAKTWYLVDDASKPTTTETFNWVTDTTSNENRVVIKDNNGTYPKASNNTFTMTDNKTFRIVLGGYNNSNGATGKDSEFNDITFDITGQIMDIYGGHSFYGNANNNKVTFIKGKVTDAIQGGSSVNTNDDNDGDAIQNYVEIQGGDIEAVVGGNADLGNANQNKVAIKGGTVNSMVFGGYSVLGETAQNEVEISGGTIGLVYGGNSSGNSAQANENKITVTGGVLSDDIFAGYAKTTYKNAVDISFDETTTLAGQQIIGGYSDTDGGSSTYNTVSINNANLTNSISTVQGGNSMSDVADYNTVTLKNTTGNGVFGGLGKLGANNNVVNITQSILDGVVIGGRTDEGSASNNKVNIVDGTIVEVNGGYSEQGAASNNTVNITGGTVKGSIYGGLSCSSADIETSSHNKVYLNGNITLSDDIYVVGGAGYSSDASKRANNNLISLDAVVNSAAAAELNLYASYADFANSSGNRIIIGKNTVIGNNVKLNLYANGGMDYLLYPAELSSMEFWAKDIKANYVQGGSGAFRNFYFILPETIQNGDTILSLDENTSVGLNTAFIGVATQSGVNLEIGDEVTLIDRAYYDNYGAYQVVDMSTVSLEGGSFTTDFTFDLSLDPTGEEYIHSLIAKVTGKKANDEIKAPAEGQVSSVALLNAGADLIANAGLENALNATTGVSGNVASFGAISGGYSKYNTGSHVNMTSVSLLTGFSKKFTDDLMSGVFVEAGYGDYTTHNTFTKGKVRGNGDSTYYGLGFMGRYDITNSFYVDASARVGYLNNDWKSKDTKVPVDYGTDSLYCGGHFGLGYDMDITDDFGLNLYGKYFYTHQEGDKATLHETKFDFKDIDSHLMRFGTRFYYSVSKDLKPFMGLAWDHEFDGKAKAKAGDVSVDAPSLKGDTGMLELGLKATQIKGSNWETDTSLQGFIGKREGIQGLVKAKYNF